ncbi:hypothetical protein ESCO_000445 [Escovopsis weberi]|uniref:Rhodopsin domain-containing protein n=1 Tax=Escovopsis weberi TaxID=150374 RepID=A0A0M8N3N4_ESCWE|nr:hypothetical protein ESCO_000445 [Escovopsis weberi]
MDLKTLLLTLGPNDNDDDGEGGGGGGPEFNAAPLVATCIVFLAASWLAVALRIYTRAAVIRCVKADDHLMLVSQAVFTSSCAFVLAGVRRGMGRHNAAIPTDDARVAALKWQALATISYILNMMLIKLSIGVFLLRVSVKPVYNHIIRVSLVVVVLWSLGIFVWDVFQCVPVEKQWDYRIRGGRCASPAEILAAAYAISALTIISDWLYALLPIPMLWSVKMSKQAKATVILILSLGIFASIATLIRFRFLSTLQDSDDLLYSATEAMTWTIIEPGVAIVASSLATIRPLLRALRVRGFADRAGSTTGAGPPGPARRDGDGDGDGEGARRAVTCTIRRFGPKDICLKDVEGGCFHYPRRSGGDHRGESSQDDSSPSWTTLS